MRNRGHFAAPWTSFPPFDQSWHDACVARRYDNTKTKMGPTCIFAIDQSANTSKREAARVNLEPKC
jgi:hypothetical protein